MRKNTQSMTPYLKNNLTHLQGLLFDWKEDIKHGAYPINIKWKHLQVGDYIKFDARRYDRVIKGKLRRSVYSHMNTVSSRDSGVVIGISTVRGVIWRHPNRVKTQDYQGN